MTRELWVKQKEEKQGAPHAHLWMLHTREGKAGPKGCVLHLLKASSGSSPPAMGGSVQRDRRSSLQGDHPWDVMG